MEVTGAVNPYEPPESNDLPPSSTKRSWSVWWRLLLVGAGVFLIAFESFTQTGFARVEVIRGTILTLLVLLGIMLLLNVISGLMSWLRRQ